MTYKDMFNATLDEAIKSAKQVSDPYKKATVMASISQALATYLAKGDTAAAVVEESAEEEKPAKATRTKRTAKKVEEPVAEEAPAEEAAPAEEPAEKKEAPKKGANSMFKRHPRKTTTDEAAEETAEDVAEETAKEAPAEEAVEATEAEPEAEAEETVNTEEFTEEWTPNALAYFAEELGQLNALKEQIIENTNDDTMYDQMIDYATDGGVANEDQINPMNVRYVLSMLSSVMENDGEDENAEEA